MKVLDANGVELEVGKPARCQGWHGVVSYVHFVPEPAWIAVKRAGSRFNFGGRVFTLEHDGDTYRCPDLIALTSKQLADSELSLAGRVAER